MLPDNSRFIKPRTDLLYKEVISSIFQAILNGKLKPGERLVEVTIAQELGVSRSPVRQALHEMENQGIIVNSPRKGSYVAEWNVDDLEDFIRVRIQLEKLAAVYAAKRITSNEIDQLYSLVDLMVDAAEKQGVVDQEIFYDMAFHKQVVKSSHNSALVQIYDAIELRIHMYMIYEKYINPSLNERIELTRAHKYVVDALKARDIDLAKSKIEESISIAARAVIGRMRKLQNQIVDGEDKLISLDRLMD